MNKTPFVSIIIPTANRPQYLPRAVRSAYTGIDSTDIEVIVVPNGPDNSWQNSLLPFQNHPAVKVANIQESNANIARNFGLAEARGKYVRFLDDDDYLLPEGALKQYTLIENSKVDVVSGAVRLVNEGDNCIGVWQQPDTDDLCEAILGPHRNCLPCAHVYLRKRLKNALWDPKTIIRQDVKWFFDLSGAMELSWRKIDVPVGVWVCHSAKRISTSMDMNHIDRYTVPMLIQVYNKLEFEGRLSDKRRRSAIQGLWALIHSSFHRNPSYWNKIAKYAMFLSPDVKPIQPVYSYPVLRKISPVWIQWLLLPKKLIFN
jgi:glycosyltransferase involved in cell wall biosynthesis